MADPVLVVRVSANLTDLRKAMQEGTSEVITTKREMANLSNSFDGSRIISQAGAVVGSIQAMGGTTKLTAGEQANANRILEAAIEKYQALGREAPKSILDLAAATKPLAKSQADADASARTLTTTYSQFDGILSSLGINIGRQVKGLEEVTSASMASASGLTKLGIGVGGAAAAFKTGWDLGRWIADMTGADAAVAKLATSLLRLGDVAAETAGAKQDVINRAIANGARETISYTDAIQFNIDAVRRNADAKINWTQRLADAHKEVRGLSEATKRDIEIAQQAGASTEELTNKFNVSALALKVLADRHKEAAAATKEHEQAKLALNRAYDKLMSDVKNANQLAIMEKDAADMATAALNRKMTAGRGWFNQLMENVKATNDQKAADAALLAQQGDGLTIIGQTVDAHKALGPAAKAATDSAMAGFAGVAQQVEISADAIRAWIDLMRYSAQANAINFGGSSLFQTQSQRERLAALPAPRAAGGPVSAGMPYIVGEKRPELFIPDRSGTIIPQVGGGVTLAPTLNFYGPVGAADFQSMVETALLNVYRSGGLALPGVS